jgi:ABC-type sugar transport system ATPase subunit
MKAELERFLSAHKPQLGLVSIEAPLISNLDVLNNIALIRQYRENLSWRNAKAVAEDLLQRLGMISIAEKRNSVLTTEERFCAMVLRAAMVRDAIVVLDRPFTILTGQRDGNFIINILQKIDDLIAEAHIFDYIWDELRYGGLHDTEN